MRIINSYSYALEDVFAVYANRFATGFFVDIGCSHPEIGSNSRLLELMGWTGVCVDLRMHAQWERIRATRCYELDATAARYDELFRESGAPPTVDLLSIDVDDACFETLTRVPFEAYSFKMVLIEHDYYRTRRLRGPEREYLRRKGFELLCSDVMHEEGKPFEDWWIDAKYFDSRFIRKIGSENELDSVIIRRFGLRNTINRLYGFNGTYPQVVTA